MGLFDCFTIFEVFIWALGKSSRSHAHTHTLTEIQWILDKEKKIATFPRCFLV